MEDDKLKNIFSEYNPDLQSDDMFMERLHRNLKAIESVRQNTRELRRHNRLAVVAAAITGFVAGVILTVSFPYISAYIDRLSMPGSAYALLRPEFIQVFAYAIIGLAATALSYTAYDLTLIAIRKKL